MIIFHLEQLQLLVNDRLHEQLRVLHAKPQLQEQAELAIEIHFFKIET